MKPHIIITAIWLFFAASIAICSDWTTLGPNEIGDFLAGIAAPPAFYWLIVGYFLQKQELSLQWQEIARLAKAQEKQTEISDKLLSLEDQRSKLVWLDEQVLKIPLKLRDLRKLLSRIDNIESPNTSSKVPVRQPDNVSDRYFAKLFSNMVFRWENQMGNEFGKIEDCIEYTDDRVYSELSYEKPELTRWMDKCHRITDEVSSDRFFVELREAGLNDLIAAIRILDLYNPEEKQL